MCTSIYLHTLQSENQTSLHPTTSKQPLKQKQQKNFPPWMQPCPGMVKSRTVYKRQLVKLNLVNYTYNHIYIHAADV